MLNELYNLSQTLKAQNISTQAWHKDYLPLPKECFRVWLNDDGSIADIESMDADLIKVCRKYGNNQRAFPSFNIAPLYRVTSDEDKAILKAFSDNKKTGADIEKLKSLCVNDNWPNKLTKKIKGCLEYELPNMPENSIISRLMKTASIIDTASFKNSIEAAIWKKIEADPKTYLKLMFYEGAENKDAEKDIGSVSIILDLKNYENDFEYPITNINTTEQINTCLQNNTANEEPVTGDCADAYNSPYTPVNQTMPVVRLFPGFDLVLRSMFREQRCQYRYNNADDNSFPISPNNRKDVKAALEWIVAETNEGKTWRKMYDDIVLFVYPEKPTENTLEFTSVLKAAFNKKSTPEKREAEFKKAAEDFIKNVNAQKNILPTDNIRIFAIKQMKPALSKRGKIVYTRDCTVEGIVKASEDWQHGCLNLPPALGIKPLIPYPMDLHEIAKNVWKQDGSSANGKSSPEFMSFSDNMDIFLNGFTQEQLSRILRSVITNWSGLVLYGANEIGKFNKSQNRNSTSKEDIKLPVFIYNLRNLLAFLGLFLYKSNIKKEDYMEDTAYIMGQILKVSDGLHALYCEIKRDGDVPPQLAGNSVFLTASETPVKALSLLGSRMAPYISWAKQYRTKNGEGYQKSGLAGWYLRQYETLMTELKHLLSQNIKFNDYDRAQLFIGYLAQIPKKEKETDESKVEIIETEVIENE